MRKLIISAALASAAFATPALARDGASYVELDGGIMFVEDLDFDIGAINNAATLSARKRDLGIKVDGYDFGATIGHDFGAFRVEGEASIRGMRTGRLDSDVRVPALTQVSPDGQSGGVAPGSYGTRGRVRVISGMFNAMADFGEDDGLQGFVGGGVGYAVIDADFNLGARGTTVVDDRDKGFAWQAIAGIRAPITRNIDAGIKYRFFNMGGIDMRDASGRAFDTRWRSHSIMGSLIFNWGGVEMIDVPPPMRPAERG